MPEAAVVEPAAAAADALLARGMALHEAGEAEAALAAFTAAAALRPGDARAHAYRGFMLLLLGHWTEGWRDYAWRARLDGGRSLPGPAWDGSPLAGRTVLIAAEQGLGDTLQMLRYLPRVAAAGGQVALAAPAIFHRLLRGFPGLARLHHPGDFVDYHVHARLFDLPLLFETTPDAVPPLPPLAPVPATASSRRIAASPAPRIGLVWAGNPAHPNDRRRSAPLGALAPIRAAAAGTCFSLQQGPARRELAHGDHGLVDLGAFADLAETAAAIAALDCVVSVDTAVAHLAGIMGKRCFLMLPAAGDWRWLIGRADTPWYPAMTLFRQERPGDWQGLAHRLASRLMQEFPQARA